MKKKFQITVKCLTDLKDTEGFSVDGNLTIDDVIDKFGVKCVEFECIKICQHWQMSSKLQQTMTPKRTIDAFQVMMTGGHAYPKLKHSRYKKNNLYH